MFKKLFSKLNNMKLRTAILVFFTALIIIIYATLSIVNISLNINADEAEAIQLSEQSLAQTAGYVETKCENIINALSSYAISENLQELIQSPTNLYVTDNAKWTTDKNEMNKILARSMGYTDIEDFFTFFDNGLSSIQRYTSDFKNTKDVEEDEWFKALNSTESIYMWFPSDINSNSENHISAVRKILNPKDLNSSIGYIQAKIPKAAISNILENSKVAEDTQAVLINSQDSIIVSTDNFALPTDGLTDFIIDSISAHEYNNNICREITIDGISYLVGINRINMTDWHYLQLTPYSSIRALSSRSMQQFLYISVIAIPLFIILAFIFSKYTSKRIHHVIGNLDAIAKHHIIEDDMYAKSRNDFENLNNSFNKMVKRLDMLLEERYQFGMEIKSLEIKMLQSQINPHFLYNSLNIINNLGLKNNIPEVSMTVDALAKFYSLSLSKGKDTISIASEIEIVRAYMTIQNMRFGDCAEFIVNVPQNLMEYKTPKLILQPIVENALWHGILESESRKGTIKLDVKLDDGDILFIVEDDGKGMTQEKLQESLQEDLSDVQHGYGTKNINDRLTIMYGDKYGLSYKSDLGKGTIAYIRIPLIK